MFGGIPATAAIARTAVNVRAGAGPKLAALTHAAALAAIVLVAALTFTVTVAMDLVTAVAVGIGVAIVLALRAVARTARLQQVPL